MKALFLGTLAASQAAQITVLVVPVMAAVTEHIGFGVTANLTYEPPYLFARRMSTLDHLTGGRVGWNIVTGYLDSAARGMGLTAQPDHDGRYDAADEYMSVPPDRVFRGADHASLTVYPYSRWALFDLQAGKIASGS